MAVTGMANLAVKVADLDAACAFYEQAGADVRDRVARATAGARAMSFVPYDRPVRCAFVGLGRIYDLNVRAYVGNPDVEVVALVDPSEERRLQRQLDWPGAKTFSSIAELAASGLDVDAVEALLPAPLHADGVVELLANGWHVNLQKPMCNDLADAHRMLEAAEANDRLLRVMENYVFYEPLRKLKEIAASGELGEVSGYHMKMVGTGRGGCAPARARSCGAPTRQWTSCGSRSPSTRAARREGSAWTPRHCTRRIARAIETERDSCRTSKVAPSTTRTVTSWSSKAGSPSTPIPMSATRCARCTSAAQARSLVRASLGPSSATRTRPRSRCSKPM
jgi:hypothetical protein